MARWSGVLFIVGKPSATSPSGARGHRILMASGAVAGAIEQLPGKPLWAHDLRTHEREISNQVGIIETAEVVGDKFMVSGEWFGRNPERIDLAASEEPLGLSYDAHCSNGDYRGWGSPILTVDRATFHGAHVVLQAKAAHKQDTSFRMEEQA